MGHGWLEGGRKVAPTNPAWGRLGGRIRAGTDLVAKLGDAGPAEAEAIKHLVIGNLDAALDLGRRS